MNHHRILIVVLMVLVTSLISCSRKAYDRLYPTLSDGKYDTEFPYRDCSEQLETISHSVFKVFCLVDYKTYLLDPSEKLLPDNISIDKLFRSTSKTVKSSEASTGTATVIYYQNSRIALLSCAHIFNYPDTIFSYYNDNDPYTEDWLSGVSIKTRQVIFIRGFPEGNDLEILARDDERDLAILGRETGGNTSDLAVFPYPLGDSEELEWGTFVYVMGFPMGYQMITRGIVSRPEVYHRDAFLIDAVFNEGFSGSIVLAIKDGVPNFELVGIGQSASVTYDNVLTPLDRDENLQYNPNVPYEGEVAVSRQRSLNYGVTFAVSTRAIKKFYQDHQKKLEQEGYFLGGFFE